ncbi:MAG: hypothetical protein EXS13_13510 [Planctomycetes bacterium]|nr:hypothetical protein [Planctomycetota bacterium]
MEGAPRRASQIVAVVAIVGALSLGAIVQREERPTLAAAGDSTAGVAAPLDARAPRELLELVDYAALEARATMVAPAGIDAVVVLAKDHLQVELWTKATAIQVPAMLLSSTRYAADGSVFFFKSDIKSLSGELCGSATLVTAASVTISGSVRRGDGNGRGKGVLVIIAKGDIKRAEDGPDPSEIDAILLSTEGSAVPTR